jgi:murein DD-endopeptidase MepM/ murein hydrolase activator NlpD
VGGKWAVCRVLIATGVLATAAIPLMAAPATAQTEPQPQPQPDPVAEAKQKVEDARREANDAAARFTDAQSSYEELGNKIAALEEKIAAGEARRVELQVIAERRALIAYKTQGSDRGAVLDAPTPREGLRSSVLLDHANQADNGVVAQLAALNAELAAKRNQLSEYQKDRDGWSSRLAAERKLLDAKVAAAYELLNALDPNALAAALTVIDGLVCPVPGAAFSNDFGAPRAGHTHQGNDMFAPTGAPNLAVVAGNVTYGNGGAGGMGAYLEGDNGVTYVYYHLSQYVGGPRRVAQGEVIGKVGSTGNASAPHTHFETRPGGRTATAINPYPTLVKICGG